MEGYLYSIIDISLIFVCTTIGALFVFIIRKKEISPKLTKIFTGFASGVMLSASFFSLIKPALESEINYMTNWAVVGIAVVLGALFLWGIDKIVPHLHVSESKEEGVASKRLSKTSKMFLAVTIHNVPEGLSVGIAFGVALSQANNHTLLIGALLLAIGIGIQNIPEGAVVSLPVRAESGSNKKAFLFGMLSGIVEPIAGVAGLFLAMQIQGIMPWALAFAAGCMIYVVVEEMIPEMTSEGHDHYGVWAFIIGFVIMMVLDCIEF
ncbi:MAG: ZIP family metal transporter [Bacilli bacterium]|nr:ZIP family metal transporter [Bacilli bacterium]